MRCFVTILYTKHMKRLLVCDVITHPTWRCLRSDRLLKIRIYLHIRDTVPSKCYQ